MKKIIFLTCTFLLLWGSTFAQHVPQGMNYQAVARDLDGQLLSNQDISLLIELYSSDPKPVVAYAETHHLTTSQLGLFSITIGNGIAEIGKFSQIPWSSEEVWMRVHIRMNDQPDYILISDSKMLSVPYAFHAGTAGDFSSQEDSRGNIANQYTKIWNVGGNYLTNPPKDKLGTADSVGLSIVTNDIERVFIGDTGAVAIAKSVFIGRNLRVEDNVYLNKGMENHAINANEFFQETETINYGNFTVEEGSSTYLTGTLTVDSQTVLNDRLLVKGIATISNNTSSTLPTDGALIVAGGVGIGENLNVGGLGKYTNPLQSNTHGDGALVVTGGVGIGSNLNVGGLTHLNDLTQSETPTDGALVVAGGVGIGKNLNVGGSAKLGGLNIKGTNPSYLVSFENTDGNSGDGLVIKLGKTHPTWDGSAYLNITSPGSELVDDVTGDILTWMRDDGNIEDLTITDFLKYYPPYIQVEIACKMLNGLTSGINEGLGLPWTTRTMSIALNVHDPVLCELKEMKADGNINWEGLEVPFSDWVSPYNNEEFKARLLARADDAYCPSCWDSDLPCEGLDGIIPDDDLYYDGKWPTVFPEIPEIPCPGDFIPDFTDMNLQLTNVTNTLSAENQFISFKDSEDRELGSIRAMSVENWEDNTLKSIIVTMASQAIGFDVVNSAFNVFTGFTQVADSYNSIGVEYASGHGDYAEWLQRIDPYELIDNGHIVGVVGGQITKDLTNAEQVMAISGKPIMLGNKPEKGKEHLGNKVAFLGQIPVKIIGPVTSGDYIVGNSHTPGYGIAINPANITSDQVRLIVGRSWDTNLAVGPKMINTVIGVDNGGFLKLIQDNQSQVSALGQYVESLNAQVSQLETKLDLIISSNESYTDSAIKSKKTRSSK